MSKEFILNGETIAVQDNEVVIEEVSALIDMTPQELVQLDKHLERQPAIFKHLQMLLSRHSKVAQKIEMKISEVQYQLELYYNGRLAQAVYKERPLQHPPQNKTELNVLINNDKSMQALNGVKLECERNLQVVEEALWQLRQRPKSVATMVEWRKYVEAGM